MIRLLKKFRWPRVALTSYVLAFWVLLFNFEQYNRLDLFKITFVVAFVTIPFVVIYFRKYYRYENRKSFGGNAK